MSVKKQAILCFSADMQKCGMYFRILEKEYNMVLLQFSHFILMDWMAIDSFIFSPATFRHEICSNFSFNFLN